MQVNEVNVKMHLEQPQDGKVLQRGIYSLMILYDMSVHLNRVCGNKVLLSGQCKVLRKLKRYVTSEIQQWNVTQ